MSLIAPKPEHYRSNGDQQRGNWEMSATTGSAKTISPEKRKELLRRYVQDGHKGVFGWFRPGAMFLMMHLDEFQKFKNIAGDFAEIGVCHGKSLIMLCLMLRETDSIFGFDLFAESGPGDEDKLRSNIETHVQDFSGISIIKIDSKEITGEYLRELSPSGFRMFSVDGNHDEDFVCNDLRLACESLSPGGILLLDDYFNQYCPSVSVGTNRFFLTSDPVEIAPFAIAGNKVFFATKPHHAEYRQFLKERSAPKIVDRLETMFSEEVVVYKF